jgi:hypothetical protein
VIHVLNGTQKIAKFNEKDLHTVDIVMAIIRLPKADTDIAISINVPVGEGQVDIVENSMINMIKNFKVNDWSLFG